MTVIRNFASDNNAGIHPEVISALVKANEGHVVGYGDDPFTVQATEKIKSVLGAEAVYFVSTGTAANVLCLKAMTQPYHAIFCAENAHLNVHECGAPERLLGCKLIDIPSLDGKLRVKDLAHRLHGIGDEHEAQPKVISITQSTEYGTVYSREEIKELSKFARAHNLFLHIDGARISNAAAALGLSLKEITADCGADALSLGGTKNGIMGGEAVVFFRKELAENFKFHRKQLMQLSSKMRFISAQMEALFAGDLWQRNARHSNAMAMRLAEKLKGVNGVEIAQKVEVNAVFARLRKDMIAPLQKKFFFYVTNPESGEVRWMTSFDTTESDIDSFVVAIRELG